MDSIKLQKKIIFTYQMEVLTGIHVGGTNSALNIGGPDNFVVRNPINNVPYIPGSSIKGKMRSLIEQRDGTIKKGGPTDDSSTNAGMLFGTAGDKEKAHASRLIVRDAPLDLSNPEMFANTDLPYTESKTEVTINRITSEAKPRTFERVPAGAKFNVSMVLNVFEHEDEQKLRKILTDAIALVEDDYIGGSGSRGYGQVKFIKIDEQTKTYR